jgi:uncharacterized protein (TIGR00369 family)
VAIDEARQAELREKMREIMTGTNFIASLGVVADEWSPDGVTLRVPFAERLTNDGKEYHGGVISALLDTAGAGAVWAGHDFDKGMRASTVSMTVNYCGRARGDLVAHARCMRRGRDLAFSEIRIEDAEGALVATGTLVYRIVP